MDAIKANETFIAIPRSVFGKDDESYLFDFYAPLVTLRGVGVYLALRNLIGQDEMAFSEFYLHNQISEGRFFEAINSLSAIGLLGIHSKKEDGDKKYIFSIFAPRTPGAFLSNALMAGTLKRYIGQDGLDKLSEKYKESTIPEGYEDETPGFTDEFECPDGVISIQGSLSRRSGSLRLYFDRKSFDEAFIDLNSYYTEGALSKEEWIQITRLSTLYGYEEATMAKLVNDSLNLDKPFGERVDFVYLEQACIRNVKAGYAKKKEASKSQVEGDSPVARTARRMDKLTPVEWLTALQKGAKPSQSDLRLLNELATDFALPDPVINALVFYVLGVKDQVLSKAYCEKLAGSLARKGFDNALDAMNYLGKSGQRKQTSNRQTYNNEPKKETKIEKTPAKPVEVDASDTDLEYDELISDWR